MDRNQIIGIVLIAVILIAYSIYTKPTEEAKTPNLIWYALAANGSLSMPCCIASVVIVSFTLLYAISFVF